MVLSKTTRTPVVSYKITKWCGCNLNPPFLEQDRDGSGFEALRQAEIVGRPVGGQEFVEGLEKSFDRLCSGRGGGRKLKQTDSVTGTVIAQSITVIALPQLSQET